MMRRTPRAAPTPAQTLLLRAVLGDGSEARGAWEKWIAAVDLDALEAESARLLPQLHLRLHALGIEHPEGPRLRGVHRSHWYRNQLLLREVVALQSLLAGHGLRSMGNDAIALAVGCHGDVGARPLHDARLLAAKSDVPRALRLAGEAGWTLPGRPPPAPLLEARAVQDLRSPSGLPFGICWRLRDGGPALEADDEIWRHGATVDVDGSALVVLGSEAVLLQICEVAAAREPRAAWVADAAALLAGESVDWNRMERHCRERGRAADAATALAFLADSFGLPISNEVVERLAEAPRPPQDFGTRLARSGDVGAAIGRFFGHVASQRRLGRSDPSYAGVRGLARYLREVHALDGHRALLAHYARRIAGVVLRRRR